MTAVRWTVIDSVATWKELIKILNMGIVYNAVSFEFECEVNWDNILNKLSKIKNIASIEHLQFLNQYNLKLQKLELFTSLKTLSLAESQINKAAFKVNFPASIEHLNLSCLTTSVWLPVEYFTAKLKRLLDKLPNLQTLNLDNTPLSQFPRLSHQHECLRSLSLDHNDIWYDEDHHINKHDLERIYYNFPHLKELTIYGSVIKTKHSKKVKQVINAYADIEGFALKADVDFESYFIACKKINYIRKYLPLSVKITSNVFKNSLQICALAFGIEFLLETMKIPTQALLRIYKKFPDMFTLLYSNQWIPKFIQANILDYNELPDVCKYLKLSKTEALFNQHIYKFVTEDGVSFSDIKLAFEKNRHYVNGMHSSYRLSHPDISIRKLDSMIHAEINMLMTRNPSDNKNIFGKLEIQDEKLKLFSVDNMYPIELYGKDVVNILYNYPSLQLLAWGRNIKLSNTYQNLQITEQALFNHLKINPNFMMHIIEDNVIKDVYQKVCEKMLAYKNKDLSTVNTSSHLFYSSKQSSSDSLTHSNQVMPKATARIYGK